MSSTTQPSGVCTTKFGNARLIQHLKINQCYLPYEPAVEEKSYYHTDLCLKAIDKIQHTFMIKPPRKLGIEANLLSLIQSIYNDLTSNITLNGKRLNVLS